MFPKTKVICLANDPPETVIVVHALGRAFVLESINEVKQWAIAQIKQQRFY